MSDYVVSARKYRPNSFENLIGQDNIAKTLKNSIARGQLAHAYLFCGPRGVGKTTSARIFAKAINCSNPSADMEPCGECESCRSFAEGRSYCIHELDAASNNGVEDIKALMDQVQIPPQVGKYSVYIIDEVHMLSQAAFNAFLKTLEEPPAYAIFILCTTEKHKIIPTILSRCQTYDFNRISVPDIMRNIRDIADKENVKIDDESIHVIARKADGAMRDALTIFDQTVAFCGTDIKYEDVLRNLNVLDYEYSFRLTDAALKGDYATALLILDEVLSKGFNALYFIVSLGEHLRDLLVSRTGGLESLLDYPETLRERYRKQAEQCSVAFIYNALGCISACEAGFKTAANQRLHIEYTLMKICFLNSKPDTAAVAAPVKGASPAKVEKVEDVKVEPSKVEKAEPAKIVKENVVQEKTEEPAPKPAAPAARPRKTASALSLTSLVEEANKEQKPLEEDASNDPIPSEEQVKEVWQGVIDMCSANQNSMRLASIFKAATYNITDGPEGIILTIKVESEATQKWVKEKFQMRMENKMRTDLGSRKFIFNVDVKPQEEIKPIIYLNEDKAKVLVQSNPELNNLIIDLDLKS